MSSRFEGEEGRWNSKRVTVLDNRRSFLKIREDNGKEKWVNGAEVKRLPSPIDPLLLIDVKEPKRKRSVTFSPKVQTALVESAFTKGPDSHSLADEVRNSVSEQPLIDKDAKCYGRQDLESVLYGSMSPQFSSSENGTNIQETESIDVETLSTTPLSPNFPEMEEEKKEEDPIMNEKLSFSGLNIVKGATPVSELNACDLVGLLTQLSMKREEIKVLERQEKRIVIKVCEVFGKLNGQTQNLSSLLAQSLTPRQDSNSAEALNLLLEQQQSTQEPKPVLPEKKSLKKMEKRNSERNILRGKSIDKWDVDEIDRYSLDMMSEMKRLATQLDKENETNNSPETGEIDVDSPEELISLQKQNLLDVPKRKSQYNLFRHSSVNKYEGANLDDEINKKTDEMMKIARENARRIAERNGLTTEKSLSTRNSERNLFRFNSIGKWSENEVDGAIQDMGKEISRLAQNHLEKKEELEYEADPYPVCYYFKKGIPGSYDTRAIDLRFSQVPKPGSAGLFVCQHVVDARFQGVQQTTFHGIFYVNKSAESDVIYLEGENETNSRLLLAKDGRFGFLKGKEFVVGEDFLSRVKDEHVGEINLYDYSVLTE